jgi:hypothetical protein
MQKPFLDYYLGRGAEDAADMGISGVPWVIRLAGDVQIQNHDGNRTAIPDVKGLVFLSVEEVDPNTKLRFGTINADGTPNFVRDVMVTTTRYAINDPSDNTAAGSFFPAEYQDDVLETRPPDPSDERVKPEPA